jgi:transposase-like protein
MRTLHQVPTPGKLRRVLKRAIFPQGKVRCPECRSINIRSVKSEERWRCRRCSHPFTLKSCCWLKGAKLPLEMIWLLLWCWQKKFSIERARDLTELSYPTVCVWYQRFREHIPSERRMITLRGKLAADEMFTRGNCVIGAKQKGTRNIAFEVLGHQYPTKTDAADFLLDVVLAGSEVCTDGSGIYRGMGNWHKLKHRYEIHKRFEFTLTAEIEGVWGCFRTFVRRMYHHVTKYKLEDIVNEFCLRFRQDEVFDSPTNYWNICLSPRPFAL